MRDVAHRAYLFIGRIGSSECDVLAHSSVEQKVVLHHNTQLRSIVSQLHAVQILIVYQDLTAVWTIERHHETDQCALS